MVEALIMGAGYKAGGSIVKSKHKDRHKTGRLAQISPIAD